MTVGDWVIATPLIVAEIVLVSALVDDSVQVATPLPLVVAVRLTGLVLLLVPEIASVTLAPAIGLSAPSRAVTVMVELLAPELAVMVVGDADTAELEAETEPAVTVTVAVWVMGVPLIVAETVLVSAVLELSVPVATPLAFVVPAGCIRLLPVVGVAARTTVAPEIGLLN